MKIYFIGICGTATGNVAILTKRLGHAVRGSDTGMYEPMKSALANAGVDAREGWNPKNLEEFAPDIVVVGNAISRMNPELEFMLAARKYKYTSLSALIGEKLIGERKSLVVSGTHGKTTTTSLAAYLLRANGIGAGWLVGGIPADLPEGGSNLGDAEAPFVIEGDEYDTAYFDKRSKFIHYRPHILLVNNIEFDHADIFRDLIDVKRTFTHVRRIVSPLGAVVENGDDPNIASLEPVPWTKRLSVGFGDNCDVRISGFVQSGDSSSFKLACAGVEKAVEWNLQGEYNARNAAMAAVGAALVSGGKNPLDIDLSALANFKGVKRRQETILKTEKILAIEDFGHHPTAIKLTLESMRLKYPERKIFAAFEPRSNTAKMNVFQDAFGDALALADAAYIGAANTAKTDPSRRIDTAAMAAKRPDKLKAFSTNAELLEGLSNDIKAARRGQGILRAVNRELTFG
ncbi:MAG: Mur ligase, partial [Opitutales bacterium]|nr:Mur ligase [Opitutales bacterium]